MYPSFLQKKMTHVFYQWFMDMQIHNKHVDLCWTLEQSRLMNVFFLLHRYEMQILGIQISNNTDINCCKCSYYLMQLCGFETITHICLWLSTSWVLISPGWCTAHPSSTPGLVRSWAGNCTPLWPLRPERGPVAQEALEVKADQASPKISWCLYH